MSLRCFCLHIPLLPNDCWWLCVFHITFFPSTDGGGGGWMNGTFHLSSIHLSSPSIDHLPIHLSIHPTHLSIYPSIDLSTSSCIHLSFKSPTYPSSQPPSHPSIYLSLYISPLSLTFPRPPSLPSIHPSTHPSTHHPFMLPPFLLFFTPPSTPKDTCVLSTYPVITIWDTGKDTGKTIREAFVGTSCVPV